MADPVSSVELFPGTIYKIEDSGKRITFDSGMVRDQEVGKTNYILVRDGPMYERWAQHLTKGAEKYEERNWMKAAGEAELERSRRSALRHFEQWLSGENNEDHAAAVFFNINQAEYIRGRLDEEAHRPDEPGYIKQVTKMIEREDILSSIAAEQELLTGLDVLSSIAAEQEGVTGLAPDLVWEDELEWVPIDIEVGGETWPARILASVANRLLGRRSGGRDPEAGDFPSS